MPDNPCAAAHRNHRHPTTYITSSRLTIPIHLALQMLLLLLASFLAASYTVFAQNTGSCDPSSSTFWDQIPALSNELQWRPCYEGLGIECARLQVPLDHFEPSVGSLNVALARYPSPLRNNTNLYKGPLIVNPGGPGASGVSFILSLGEVLSEIFDGRYDIVSFDPRGIGRSGRVSFFKTDVERALFNYLNPINEMDFRPDGVAYNWATSAVVGKLAVAQDNGTLRYINTEQTAHDMLAVVEAYGYEKLQFWGLSYGTVLGATFAGIFPDKVERLILDGVVDSNKWYKGQVGDMVMDAGKVLQGFFDACYEVGPDNCAFYAPSPEAISDNLNALYAKIRAEPVPVVTEDGYAVIDYPTLRGALFVALYNPYTTFSIMAQALAELALGSGEIFYRATAAASPPFECSCDAPTDIGVAILEGLMSVTCNDFPQLPTDLAWSVAYVEEASQYDFGTLFSGLGIGCSGWTTSFPKDHFTGPFTANTSHPILFIGNTADPATSIVHARAMSEGFEGSVLLTHDALGHSSLAIPTPCLLQNLREYFINGTLPAVGTVCPVDVPLFPAPSAGNSTARRGEVDQLEKWSQMLREITGSKMRVSPLGIL